jgi:hypothetical protein
MKMPIELRFAILTSLLMLLWLALEFMVGLHDKYIPLHPIITMFAFIIPVVTTRVAIKEKREMLGGQITFKKALATGLIITALTALFAVPVQLIFHNVINPDFFDNMIEFAVLRAKENHQNTDTALMNAKMYFNLKSYLIQSVAGTLIVGTIISVVAAFLMRTKK